MKKINIEIGTKYGRWTVLGEGATKIEPSGRKRLTLRVKCNCGTIKDICKQVLMANKSQSCGCLQKEICSNIGKKTGPINAKNAQGWNKGLYGKNNPNYKGNCNKAIRIRNSDEYKDWRTACFERDNYTCQISGQKGDIIVHHLNPFHLIISDLDNENFRNCELLWDINNGITILRTLHNKFHKKYGTRKFTKENFLEFKNNYKYEPSKQ